MCPPVISVWQAAEPVSGSEDLNSVPPDPCLFVLFYACFDARRHPPPWQDEVESNICLQASASFHLIMSKEQDSKLLKFPISQVLAHSIPHTDLAFPLSSMNGKMSHRVEPVPISACISGSCDIEDDWRTVSNLSAQIGTEHGLCCSLFLCLIL